ncbi:MAG: MBOAT family protein [Saprospiraceae bacterium]|nr:MBOAT family protein [Candidatus Vicinibacter affinis]
MVFSSLLFLTVFFPLFVLGYFLLPGKINIKHLYILAASFIFYAWGEPKFVWIVFFTTIVDYFLVKKMNSYDDPFKRKLFLVFPILLNVGLLSYFKYFNFFVDSFNQLGSIFDFPLIKVSQIVLPIGISFFTFESITYSVDVYRRVHKPLDKFWEYQMYIIFFPKLIAGPIVRYHEISEQIKDHIHHDHLHNRMNGFIRFVIGLGKKVLIANVVGRQADLIFGLSPEQLTTPISWLGALAYTVQIYFDFSGYSDMAIGISRMLGFKLPENFNHPYVSKSVTEFWKRWHITLGNWMRNYLYIPLGGNRATKERVLFNLFLVFILSGFWHGAGWNFIVWGMYYGLFLVGERILIKKGNLDGDGMRSYIGMLYTFMVVVIGWVFFRLEDLPLAFKYIHKMFSFDFSHDYVFVFQEDFFFFLVAGLLLSFSTLNSRIDRFQQKVFEVGLYRNELYLFVLLGIAIYFICLISLSGGLYNPFIYFKF